MTTLVSRADTILTVLASKIKIKNSRLNYAYVQNCARVKNISCSRNFTWIFL